MPSKPILAFGASHQFKIVAQMPCPGWMLPANDQAELFAARRQISTASLRLAFSFLSSAKPMPRRTWGALVN